jgi:hypothetical protein
VPADDLSAATDRFVGAVLANPAAAVLATTSLLRAASRRSADERLAAERLAQGERLRALAREARARS